VSYRTKLLALFTATVVVAVVSVTWIVSSFTRRAFERLDNQRTAALVAQFRREFARRGEEVTSRVEGIAQAEETTRLTVALSRPKPDYSAYVNEAPALAAAHQLDFLELIAPEGSIISSAQWPARFGYKEDWVLGTPDWASSDAFLKREELPDRVALALVAVRAVRIGEKNLFIVGGRSLDKEFLASLVLPAGMRALLYRHLDQDVSAASLTDASGPVAQGEKLIPLITRVRRQPRELAETIQWTHDPASAETFHALPLVGRQGEVLGMFLVGSSRREQVELERRIRFVALIVGGAGILLGLVLSGWAASRVTRPVESLAGAARQVAGGNWDSRVEIQSSDELGELARAFNQMTQQLVEQRDRLVQAERVAAWRELARRLAHELKNPLFPLQITVENLLRAREQHAEQFEEVFRESAATLLAELANMRTIIGRFSDFAKMPRPQVQPVKLNELVRGVAKLFEPQIKVAERPLVAMRLELAENLEEIQADPDLLHRAVQNLVLNALDAMPSGGTLTLRTEQQPGRVSLAISDTGKGLTPEECERLFTPYYTTKQHGTGLGLAIVQSVVSDHGGKISVESDPERGTTFRIELPVRPPATASIETAADAARQRA
jgi:two-component system nitrogen regulation sensor histidine kinase NtrY